MLAELTAGSVADSERRRGERPLEAVEAAAHDQTPARDALVALAAGERVKIIAEVKRASPSRGPLADIPDPSALARAYERGGASAISVLTEERRFGGSLADLESVRASVDVPLLRKDFIATEYQLLEARAAGADLVLLIVAALDDARLHRLYRFALDLGMAVLVETHNADEISRAIDCGADIIGVNARNLTTFELDRDLFSRVVDTIPDGVIRVAESAVLEAADIFRYRSAGADVVLVGEALVTSDPVARLREFLEV